MGGKANALAPPRNVLGQVNGMSPLNNALTQNSNMGRDDPMFQIGLSPFDPTKNHPVQLPGGNIATEYSATSQAPDGTWIVHPQIWWDQSGNPVWMPDEQGLQTALSYEAMGNKPFPRFKSLSAAEAWSTKRSHNGGGTKGAMDQ